MRRVLLATIAILFSSATGLVSQGIPSFPHGNETTTTNTVA